MLMVSASVGACGGTPEPKRTAPSLPPYPTLELRAESLPVEQRFAGTVEAVKQATISAETPGRVTALPFDVNDKVTAGSILVRLRGTEQRADLAQAEASLTEAVARDAEAQTRHGRIADMQARKVVPLATLDEATANRDAANARLQSARAAVGRAQQGLAYTAVQAPYAAIITQRHVQIGELVAPGSPLITAASLESLRVTVDLPQNLVEAIRRRKQAFIYVGDQRLAATDLEIFPVATPMSGTVRARANLPAGTSGLYPGMTVEVGLVVGEDAQLLIPAQSIVERSEVTAVYVFTTDGRTALRQVRLGRHSGDRAEVVAGLESGDRIALDPLLALQHHGDVSERAP